MAQVRPLNKVLQETAIAQLNEDHARIPGDIEILRTWIQQQPHLKSRTDDQYLLTFLRGCKFSLEKAKSKLDKYHAFRTKYPDLFRGTDVDDPKLREILRAGLIFVLPKPLHEHGPRIVMMCQGVCSPEIYTVEDISRAICAVQEIVMLEDDYAIVNGVIAIMDTAGCTHAHFMRMTPSVMKKLSAYSEDALPLRQKASHFINTPSGFEPVFNIIKPLLSKKQQDRLFVHGNKMEMLYEQIPQKYLPKEYGGENGSIGEIIAVIEQKLDEYRTHFKENANYGTDEKLRPGKPLDFDNIFGVDGSFRKLNVD